MTLLTASYIGSFLTIFIRKQAMISIVSRTNLYILFCLTTKTSFNVGSFLFNYLHQVAVDKKNKKPKIMCGGVIIAFAQHFVDFSVPQNTIPWVSSETFFTLEMLKNIGICKRQKDESFAFAPSRNETTRASSLGPQKGRNRKGTTNLERRRAPCFSSSSYSSGIERAQKA